MGAGIGYFSAIASDIVGDSGQVHCFEPNPTNVMAIQRMIQSHPNPNIILNSYALGIDDTIHHYYKKKSHNGTYLTMVDGLFNPQHVTESFTVTTRRLDKYLEDKKIVDISLIKIDVEGYEYPVLRGAEGYFQRAKNRPPIICEISPHVCKYLKYTLNELYDYMRNYDYQAIL